MDNRLHSLYASQGGVAAIFSLKVDDYCASRPDYPDQLFELLQSRCKLDGESVIADLGAGTGLLTRKFLQLGYRVFAVKPNAEKRAACDQYLGGFETYRSFEGRAEAIPLESASVDLIVAAQAFHWFEVEKAREECLRVLVREGRVALIWNDRLLSDPLHVALDELFADLGGEKRSALVAHEVRRNVPAFFRSSRPAEFTWQHEHFLDQQGLLSLVFSRSYMPKRDSLLAQTIYARVSEIFDELAIEGKVSVRYTTIAMVGRPE